MSIPRPARTSVVSSGGSLDTPRAIVLDDNGDAWVADGADGQIIRIDVDTGAQTVFASGGFLNASITGIARDENGDFLVTDDADNELVRIDAGTAAQSVVSSNDKLLAPLHLAVHFEPEPAFCDG